MDGPFFLKTRSNITVEGDLRLAENEIGRFFEEHERVDRYEDLASRFGLPRRYVTSNSRAAPPIGFLGSGPTTDLRRCISSLCFVQEVWMPCLDRAGEAMAKEAWWNVIATEEGRFSCALPFMAAGEYLTPLRSCRVSASDLSALTTCLCDPNSGEARFAAAIRRVNTSNPHVHGLHKYKAKFFPRLVRHLLVSHLPQTPVDGEGRRSMLDPFVGSGTSVVEAGLLGIPSIGTDIDRLSCTIGRAKILLASADPTAVGDGMKSACREFGLAEEMPITTDRYEFPPWIARKFERNGTERSMQEYETEITRWAGVLAKIPESRIREIAEVCFSDALSRKFHIRMMGTGVGRFALEIRKASITSLMHATMSRAAHASRVISTLIGAYRIRVEQPVILNADARRLPLPDDSISMVLTSPPYLPASSGREDYLVGKSIAITALDLMHPDAIARSEARSIGSMKANGSVRFDRLPDGAKDLYAWLKDDELRCIKAEPVALYYHDLRDALRETYRVLMPGGRAIYIVGKESVFYNYRDRRILYRVACDRIFLQMAADCGFLVDAKVDIQLDKKQGPARPRSTDEYYESICILAKPA